MDVLYIFKLLLRSYLYLQVKVYFSDRDHWFHAVCCTTIFSRMHHTRISNETETKTTNWVVLDAQKNHFTFPQKGAYYFLQCLKEYFHLWRHFEVSSLLLFSVVSGSDNAMTNFSDRHRSHLRLPPLYGYALL